MCKEKNVVITWFDSVQRLVDDAQSLHHLYPLSLDHLEMPLQMRMHVDFILFFPRFVLSFCFCYWIQLKIKSNKFRQLNSIFPKNQPHKRYQIEEKKTKIHQKKTVSEDYFSEKLTLFTDNSFDQMQTSHWMWISCTSFFFLLVG